MVETIGYAATSATARLSPFRFHRREPGPHDIQIQILYCGVCHSDLMFARNELGWTTYPLVPGHEIVGRVTRMGAEVTGFAPGDRVGVGTFVDSCRVCAECGEGHEQFCDALVPTYGAPDKNGNITQGGYAKTVVVDAAYVLHIPDTLDLAAAAPLLCAGITVYTPLRQWKVGKGSKVGVVGLGGLGHLGVKLAKAMGAEVVVFTTSPSKQADALRLGASEVRLSSDPADLRRHAADLDLILDTVSSSHDLDEKLSLLRRYGTLVLVGVPPTPHPAPDTFLLLGRNRALAGSAVGGIRDTQEMLEFCARHNIVSDIELIPIDRINEAYERMLKNDVKYRFVIDLATLNHIES